MNKVNELTKKQKEDEKLFEAKIIDKIKQSKSRNRFTNSDFLDLSQQENTKKIMLIQKAENCKLYGGYEEAERKMLVVFPEEISEYTNKDNFYNQVMKIIRINLPKELYSTYEHKNYLGALMKLGVRREKIGDILVRADGADIIISADIEKFILLNIGTLNRFKKADIQSISINNLIYTKTKEIILKINIPSMRLDCIVGELARCSRSEALEIIRQERVFVNFKEELSQGKQISENTYVTIRGKGRFKILKIEGKTRSGRLTVSVSQLGRPFLKYLQIIY